MSNYVVIVNHVDKIYQGVHFFDSLDEAEKFFEFIVNPNREVTVYERITD